jgi:hypothetical protein
MEIEYADKDEVMAIAEKLIRENAELIERLAQS